MLPCFNRSVIFRMMISHHRASCSAASSSGTVAIRQPSDTDSLQSSVLRMLESCKSASQIKQLQALVVKIKPLQNQLIYNAIIQGLSSSKTLESFLLYREMLMEGLLPNNYTLPFVLRACTQSRALSEGKQIHSHAIKTGLLVSNVYVCNTLLRLYVVCDNIRNAQKLFDRSPKRDVVTWTTLIQGYVKTGMQRDAVEAFFVMCEDNLVADEMTLVIVLSACSKLGDLSLGRRLHRYIHESSVNRDVFVGNALVDMFLKCGDADLAYEIFNEMLVKNVVSWNSMILGLAQQGKFKEALAVFEEMQKERVKPDDVTLVGVLNSCANLGLLELGRWVHTYIDKHKFRADSFIGNALVDMYGKCGRMDLALGVFERMKLKDVYSYTAIISGLAMHGEARLALDIFDSMSKSGINPDEVTFVGLLSACSHAGLVEEGLGHFKNMSRIYRLEPQNEHYGCVVDLLGRAGRFTEAEEFIKNMPIEPDAFVWGALLGACRLYGKVELGENVMKRLMEIEPDREGAYILMSNMYSSAERWRDALNMRKSMKAVNVKKVPGCSSIEVDGTVHEFRKGDKSHPKSNEIAEFLENLTFQMKSYGQRDIIS